MEKVPVYEVRCEHCKTSFAPGTKSCVHCGRPLGGRLAQILGAPGQSGHSGDELPESLAEAEEQEPVSGGRSPVWVLTALFLVVSAVVRACAER